MYPAVSSGARIGPRRLSREALVVRKSGSSVDRLLDQRNQLRRLRQFHIRNPGAGVIIRNSMLRSGRNIVGSAVSCVTLAAIPFAANAPVSAPSKTSSSELFSEIIRIALIWRAERPQLPWLSHRNFRASAHLRAVEWLDVEQNGS